MRRWSGWVTAAMLAVVAALQGGGCEGPPDAPELPGANEVLAMLPDVVVRPRLTMLRERLAVLEERVAQWDASGAAEDRDLAKVAFVEAMELIQELDPMQLGPYASSAVSPFGLDLRDALYSWPVVNPCRVDQIVAEGGWEDPGFFTDERVHAFGMDALEYLLWAGPENACPNQVAPNADGRWEALGVEGVERARASYAAAVGGELLATVDRLQRAWAEHALDAATYGTERDALEAVVGALHYLESTMEKRKLAEPAGRGTCTTGCLEQAESYGLSSGSQVWLARNLVGVRALFTGEEGPGLPEILAAVGRQELADRFLDALDRADEAVEALDGPVEQAIVERPARIDALLAVLRELTELLEGEIAASLLLELPMEAAGDAD